jgi:phosphohistidine phosphatase SixA
MDELGGEAEPEEVLRALARTRAGDRHVLLVGHQPQMGQIAFHLTGRETAFAPGTLVRIAVEGPLSGGGGHTLLTFAPTA